MPDSFGASKIRDEIGPFLLVADGMSARGEPAAVGSQQHAYIGR